MDLTMLRYRLTVPVAVLAATGFTAAAWFLWPGEYLLVSALVFLAGVLAAILLLALCGLPGIRRWAIPTVMLIGCTCVGVVLVLPWIADTVDHRRQDACVPALARIDALFESQGRYPPPEAIAELLPTGVWYWPSEKPPGEHRFSLRMRPSLDGMPVYGYALSSDDHTWRTAD